MECRERNIVAFDADQAVHTVAHFIGGFVCESYSKYFPRFAGVFINKVRYTIRDDPGFSASRTCKDKHGAFEGFHRYPLLRIEVGLQFVIEF